MNMKKVVLSGLLAVTLSTSVATFRGTNEADAAVRNAASSSDANGLLNSYNTYEGKARDLGAPYFTKELRVAKYLAEKKNKVERLQKVYKEIDEQYKDWLGTNVRQNVVNDLKQAVQEGQETVVKGDRHSQAIQLLEQSVKKGEGILIRSANEGDYKAVTSEIRLALQQVESEKKYRWTEAR